MAKSHEELMFQYPRLGQKILGWQRQGASIEDVQSLIDDGVNSLMQKRGESRDDVMASLGYRDLPQTREDIDAAEPGWSELPNAAAAASLNIGGSLADIGNILRDKFDSSHSMAADMLKNKSNSSGASSGAVDKLKAFTKNRTPDQDLISTGLSLASATLHGKAKDVAPEGQFTGDFSDNPSWKRAAHAVANGAGSFAPAAILTFITKNPSMGAALLSSAQGADTYNSAIKAGKSKQEAEQIALVDAVMAYGLERFGLENVMKGGGNILKRAATGSVSEGGTELLQNMGSNSLAKFTYNPTREITAGNLESFIGGAGSGGMVSALIGGRGANNGNDGDNSAVTQPRSTQPPSVQQPETDLANDRELAKQNIAEHARQVVEEKAAEQRELNHDNVDASDSRTADEVSIMNADPEAKPAVIMTADGVMNSGVSSLDEDQGNGKRLIKVESPDGKQQHVMYDTKTVGKIVGKEDIADIDAEVRKRVKSGETGDILFNSKAKTPQQGEVDTAITKDGDVLTDPAEIAKQNANGNIATAAKVKADEVTAITTKQAQAVKNAKGATISEAELDSMESDIVEGDRVEQSRDAISDNERIKSEATNITAGTRVIIDGSEYVVDKAESGWYGTAKLKPVGGGKPITMGKVGIVGRQDNGRAQIIQPEVDIENNSDVADDTPPIPMPAETQEVSETPQARQGQQGAVNTDAEPLTRKDFKRDKDFDFNGEYVADTAEGEVRIFRDKEQFNDPVWYRVEPDGKTTRIGNTMAEAIDAINKASAKRSGAKTNENAPQSTNTGTDRQGQAKTTSEEGAEREAKGLDERVARIVEEANKVSTTDDVVPVGDIPESTVRLVERVRNMIGTTRRIIVTKARDFERGPLATQIIKTVDGDAPHIIEVGDFNGDSVLEFEAIVHEVGHTIVDEELRRADPKTKEAIVAEFQRHQRYALDMDITVAEWMEMTRGAGFLSNGNVGTLLGGLANAKMSQLTPESLRYLLSFDEWAANQTARYVMNREASNQSSVVKKFFSAVAKKLKAFYKKAHESHMPAEEFASFIKRLDERSAEHVNSIVSKTIPEKKWKMSKGEPVTTAHIDKELTKISDRTEDGRKRRAILGEIKARLKDKESGNIDKTVEDIENEFDNRIMSTDSYELQDHYRDMKRLTRQAGKTLWDAANPDMIQHGNTVIDEDTDQEQAFYDELNNEIFGTQHKVDALSQLVSRFGIDPDAEVDVEAKDNVSVFDTRPEKGIGFFQSLFGTPSKIKGNIRYYVTNGIHAINAQDKMRGKFSKRIDAALKDLSPDERATLTDVMFDGDIQEKNFTDEELDAMDGVNDRVKKAYRDLRSATDIIHSHVDRHRRKYMTKEQREAGELGLGYREGYVPHLFENWMVYEVGADGTLHHATGDTTRRSLAEAEALARSMDSTKQYVIKPKTPNMPEILMSKIVVGDAEIHKLEQRISDAYALTIDEAAQVVKGETFLTDVQAMELAGKINSKQGASLREIMDMTGADREYAQMIYDKVRGESMDQAKELVKDMTRKVSKRRHWGHAQQRTGAEGYVRDDIGKILKVYANSAARYMAMDDFKAAMVPQYKKDFGVEFTEDASRATRGGVNNAHYVQQYAKTILGHPSQVENLFDATLIKLMGEAGSKRIRSQRPVVWGVNRVLHFNSVTKLGLLNPASAAVNLTQLINSLAKMPTKHFIHGVNMAKKRSKNLPQELQSMLKNIGIEYDAGLEDTGMHSATHKAGGFAAASAIGHYAGKVTQGGMYLFSRAEYFNRKATAIGAYSHARTDLGYSRQQATDYARRIVDTTQFNYSAADTARIFNNPAGRLLGQFRPFAMKQMGFITGGINYRNKAEVMKFWGATMLMSGVAGIPMAVGLGEAIKYLTGVFRDDDGIDPYVELRKAVMDAAVEEQIPMPIAEVLLYGVGSQAGIDLSGRTGLSDIVPQRASDMLGPTINTMYQLTGDMPLLSTSTVKTLAPSLGSIVGAMEIAFNDGKVVSHRKDDALMYVGDWKTALAKGMGFRPLVEAKNFDVSRVDKYRDGNHKKLMHSIEVKVADALMDGDFDKVHKIIEQGAARVEKQFGKGTFTLSESALANLWKKRILTERERRMIGTGGALSKEELDRGKFLND